VRFGHLEGGKSSFIKDANFCCADPHRVIGFHFDVGASLSTLLISPMILTGTRALRGSSIIHAKAASCGYSTKRPRYHFFFRPCLRNNVAKPRVSAIRKGKVASAVLKLAYGNSMGNGSHGRCLQKRGGRSTAKPRYLYVLKNAVFTNKQDVATELAKHRVCT
jgi:hypothetical protein